MDVDLKQCESLLSTIEEVSELSLLRSYRHQFQQAFEHSNLVYDVVRSNEIINKMHDRLIKRSIEIAEKEMIGEGLGPPPSPYCYLLLGSGGRQEQTFGSDQDSALVFADVASSEDQLLAQQYFMLLANKIVQNLQSIGYSPCDGKVQSNVEMWCKPVSDWINQIQNWIEESNWESIRYLLICSDIRSIHGDTSIFDQLQNNFYRLIEQNSHVYQRMIDNTVHHRVMVNVFGQLLTVKYGEHYGSIDIKYGAYIPFVNAIRWLSIRHNIKATSTLARLEQLYLKKQFSDDEYLQYRRAFIQFLSLRLQAGFVEVNDYFESYSMINPKSLDKHQINQLKKNLQVGRKLQKHIQYFMRHSSR